jgi:hypothetical protein
LVAQGARTVDDIARPLRVDLLDELILMVDPSSSSSARSGSIWGRGAGDATAPARV